VNEPDRDETDRFNRYAESHDRAAEVRRFWAWFYGEGPHA